MKASTPNIKVIMKEEIKFFPDLDQDKDVLLLLQFNIALRETTQQKIQNYYLS